MTGKILIIDDEIEFIRSIQRHLKRNGISVDLATDGGEGLKLIKESCRLNMLYGVVILDLILPNMNGSEVALEIQQKYPQISIIFISMYVHDPDIRRIGRMSKDSFLKKPFTPEELLRHISRVFSKLE